MKSINSRKRRSRSIKQSEDALLVWFGRVCLPKKFAVHCPVRGDLLVSDIVGLGKNAYWSTDSAYRTTFDRNMSLHKAKYLYDLIQDSDPSKGERILFKPA